MDWCRSELILCTEISGESDELKSAVSMDVEMKHWSAVLITKDVLSAWNSAIQRRVVIHKRKEKEEREEYRARERTGSEVAAYGVEALALTLDSPEEAPDFTNHDAWRPLGNGQQSDDSELDTRNSQWSSGSGATRPSFAAVTNYSALLSQLRLEETAINGPRGRRRKKVLLMSTAYQRSL
jgi:hypothetical protein